MDLLPLKLTEAERERLYAKVEVDEVNGCWLWMACKNNDGYGQFWLRGQMLCAHRVWFEHVKGNIPKGLQLDHYKLNNDYNSCARNCINPDHLEPVTSKENLNRSPRLREARRTCAFGNKKTARACGLASRLEKNAHLPEGVRNEGKKYGARIRDPKKRKTVRLGTFSTPELASTVYQIARKRVDAGLPAKGFLKNHKEKDAPLWRSADAS